MASLDWMLRGIDSFERGPDSLILACTQRRGDRSLNQSRILSSMKGVIQYLDQIKIDKAILWCYLIWYVVIVYFYFDPAPKIWINSLGISAVIGTGLILSVSSSAIAQVASWQTFRLYLMPFCVSSFSALIKDQGFIIVISPRLTENLVAGVGCLLFLSITFLSKFISKKV